MGKEGSTYDEYHRLYYQAHKEEILEERRKTRELRRRLHLCIHCGHQDARTLIGKAVCGDCQEYDTERKRKARGNRPAWERDPKPRKDVNRPRGDNGICWQCNKLPKLEGYKLCRACYDKKVQILRENNYNHNGERSEHPWRRTLNLQKQAAACRRKSG